MATSNQALVLVVDDYDDARELWAEFLELSGYRVEQASDGAQAVEKGLSLRPDVVLMDLSLPVMDGWEATRRLKEDVRTRHIPIIALTGHAIANTAAGGQPNCDGYIIKPCGPDTMLEEVRRVLGAPSA